MIDKDAIPPKIELISAGHSGTINLIEAGNGQPGSVIEGRIDAQMGLIKVRNYITTEY